MTNGEVLLMVPYITAGIVMMALNPLRAIRGWNSEYCSCTSPVARDPNCAVHGGKR